jgi:hypothetical protein
LHHFWKNPSLVFPILTSNLAVMTSPTRPQGKQEKQKTKNSCNYKGLTGRTRQDPKKQGVLAGRKNNSGGGLIRTAFASFL